MLLITLLNFLFLGFLFSLAAAYGSLSDTTLEGLPSSNDDFDIHNGALLAPILRTRVPGTPGSAAVLQHFVDFFRTTLPEWELSFQNSTSKTPATGKQDVPFVNLIATRDPPWASGGDVGRLTLVAHYDSKLSPKGFIGAIDSAAPCAMLMHVARSIEGALVRKWEAMKDNGDDDGLDGEKGVQILLLDGEEAFVQWTDTDSLYGSRSLAESWEETAHPATSVYKTPLSSISLFVLLDLLGSKLGGDTVIRSYYKTTHWAYQSMAKLESRLRSLKQFKSSPNHPKNLVARGKSGGSNSEPLFMPESDKSSFLGGTISDDHEPFMARGVEVLHLIPYRFPTVWHTLDDDGEHLDIDTVEDWARLVTAFAGEWMELEGFFDPEENVTAPKKRWNIPISKTEL